MTRRTPMGLKLRYHLYRDVSAADVLGAYKSYYSDRLCRFATRGAGISGLDIHPAQNGWVVVSLNHDNGWNWKERRTALSFVSRRLWCVGLLIFVYDGDYWGYELIDRGEAIDHFVQESAEESFWFPGLDCRGNARAFEERLPFLKSNDIEPYLLRKNDWVIPEGTNIPARPGDIYRRFDECAVLDFLRMLGVGIEVSDRNVRLLPSI